MIYFFLKNQPFGKIVVEASNCFIHIERSKIRNGQAITNINTPIYSLINLRTLQRIRQPKADPQTQAKLSASAA
jgi:hypothetical protein